MDNNFPNDFSKKIFAKIVVVCKSLKTGSSAFEIRVASE